MAQVDYSALDDPNISLNSFFPRQGWTPTPEGVQDYTVNVGDDIGLSCRFFPYGNSAPTILFFYGNGETAIDYDAIAPFYNQIGLNFFVADKFYGANFDYLVRLWRKTSRFEIQGDPRFIQRRRFLQ